MRRQVKSAPLYFVGLSNGLETYPGGRVAAERVFMECAAVGRCSMGFIRDCVRHTLAESIDRNDAATLGAYERAVFRAS